MSPDVVDLIMQDHREVERLFALLREDQEQRAGAVPLLTSLLGAHSRAEEAAVYPAAKDEAGIADDVEHSQEEHLQADQILAELASADPGSASFDAVLARLVDAVTHHVEEEESSVLPEMRARLERSRLEELGQAFLESRGQHLGGQPGELTLEELRHQARNAGLAGASGMAKDELADQLAARVQR